VCVVGDIRVHEVEKVKKNTNSSKKPKDNFRLCFHLGFLKVIYSFVARWPAFKFKISSFFEYSDGRLYLISRSYLKKDRVSKPEEKGSQSSGPGKQDKASSPIDAGCSKTQIDEWHISKHKGNARNNANGVPDA